MWCVIEAIAEVVLDLNETPVGGTESFDPTVKRAHDLHRVVVMHVLADRRQAEVVEQAEAAGISAGQRSAGQVEGFRLAVWELP